MNTPASSTPIPTTSRSSPKACFGHYLIMAGALGGRDWTAPGTQLSEYENAFGTGQVHVWFDLTNDRQPA